MSITWIAREIESEFKRVSREYPVVTITGPRQSGKTSLAKHCCHGYSYANLELPDIRRLAQSDPRAFFKAYPAPVIIDEVQRVPDLLSYIQVLADNESKRGQYILTGSHQMELGAAISQSLAGRTALLRLLPLSLKELSAAGITLTRDQYIHKGFMPRLHKENIRPSSLYSEYFQNYIERDLRQLINIRDLSIFERFLRVLAGRTGQLINLSSLAGDVGVSRITMNEWMTALEASLIIFRLPPWFNNANNRVIKSQKIYFTEPGLVAWLLDIESASQVARDPLMGNLFENVVVVEALKSRLNQGRSPNLFFYRDVKGNEVDLVIRNQRKLHPVEIKAGMTFSRDMTKGISLFNKRFDMSSAGAVIYAGELETQMENISLVNFRNTCQAIENDLK